MSYNVTKLPDQPVLILKLLEDYDIARDFPKSYAQVSQFLETTDEPVYYIIDLSGTPIDMNLILEGVNRTSVNTRGTFRHPMTRGVIFVTPDPVAGSVAAGLSHETFGNIDARVFDSLDDALDYVQAHT